MYKGTQDTAVMVSVFHMKLPVLMNSESEKYQGFSVFLKTCVGVVDFTEKVLENDQGENVDG